MIESSINKDRKVTLTIERLTTTSAKTSRNVEPTIAPDVAIILQKNRNFFLKQHRLPPAIQMPGSSAKNSSSVVPNCELNVYQSYFLLQFVI